MEHPIENLMMTAMNSLRDMIDVNTVVGDTVETIDGTTIIPVSKVAFGYAAGGSEFNSNKLKTYGPDNIPVSKNATNAPILAERNIYTNTNIIAKNSNMDIDI